MMTAKEAGQDAPAPGAAQDGDGTVDMDGFAVTPAIVAGLEAARFAPDPAGRHLVVQLSARQDIHPALQRHLEGVGLAEAAVRCWREPPFWRSADLVDTADLADRVLHAIEETLWNGS